LRKVADQRRTTPKYYRGYYPRSRRAQSSSNAKIGEFFRHADPGASMKAEARVWSAVDDVAEHPRPRKIRAGVVALRAIFLA